MLHSESLALPLRCHELLQAARVLTGAGMLQHMTANSFCTPGFVATPSAEGDVGCMGLPGGSSSDAGKGQGKAKGKGKGKGKSANPNDPPTFPKKKKLHHACMHVICNSRILLLAGVFLVVSNAASGCG